MMAAYLGEVNLFKFLSDINEMSNAVDWGLLSVEKYDQLMVVKKEATELLAEISRSILRREQPLYQVRVLIADNPESSNDSVVRLDKLVETYPFLLEALVLAKLDEISFLDKESLTSVQITKL